MAEDAQHSDCSDPAVACGWEMTTQSGGWALQGFQYRRQLRSTLSTATAATPPPPGSRVQGFAVKSGCWRVAGASVSSAEPCAAENVMLCAGKTGAPISLQQRRWRGPRVAGMQCRLLQPGLRSHIHHPWKNRAQFPLLVPVLDSCPEPWSRALRFR